MFHIFIAVVVGGLVLNLLAYREIGRDVHRDQSEAYDIS